MSLGHRLRYRFDNLMARGVGAQVLLLVAFTVLVVVLTVALLVVFDVVPKNDQGHADSHGLLAWKALMHTMDPGNLGGDSGSWTYLFVYLFATIGGLFVVSALIGVLNQGFGALLEKMRRGHSTVVERGHTVILGWSPKIHTLLQELAEANRNQRGACVAILADRDKVEMDAEIAKEMKHRKLRIVTRTGSTMATADLALVSLTTSKAVIVLAAEHDATGAPISPTESDTIVLKTLLAINKVADGQQLHVVAEIFDERSEPVARMVVGEHAALILPAPLVSRLLVQTGRQSGLSVVYTELLDFEGCEIYVAKAPNLTGKTFREAIFAYGTSTLIGLLTGAGEMMLPPPLDRTFAEDDQIVAISEDDDTVIADGAGITIDDRAISGAASRAARRAERTLILGASHRLPLVLRELDSYVAPGSETVVHGEAASAALGTLAQGKLANMRVEVHDADVTDRGVLEALDITRFDHILLLSELSGRTQEMADARTTVTLLYLRDIAHRVGKHVPMTSEILEIQSRDLATVAEADDFIVSNTLVSLMISQVAENPHLVHVFDELFSSEGYEIYLKRATDYVKPDSELAFATVCEAALRKQEIAIGYRLVAKARDPQASYGVLVNPPKRERVRFTDKDQIIVLAES